MWLNFAIGIVGLLISYASLTYGGYQAGLVGLGFAVYSLIVGLITGLREFREEQHQVEESTRESERLSNALPRALWHSQEWLLDTRLLQDAKAEQDWTRVTWRTSVRFQFPIAVGMVFLLACYFFPLNTAWGAFIQLYVSTILCILCWLWAAVRFVQYRRLKKRIETTWQTYQAMKAQQQNPSSPPFEQSSP